MGIDWEPGIMLLKHYGPWMVGMILAALAGSMMLSIDPDDRPRRNRRK